MGSLPHSVTARALCDAPLLRVACNGDRALVIVSADLSLLSFDPQTTGRDATRGPEAHGRARTRPAQAGRAEISEWDVDSRFHRKPRYCSDLCGSGGPLALERGVRRFYPDPATDAQVTQTWYKYKVAPRCSLAVRCTVEVVSPPPGGEVP